MTKIPVSKGVSKVEYAIRDLVLPATKLEKEGHEVIKLNIGDPLAYPNFPTPKHMVDAYIDALKNQKNGYSPSYGIESLRVAISNFEKNQKNGGWNCNPSDVYITSGVSEALLILFASFLFPNDKILTPGPFYPPYVSYPPIFKSSVIQYRLMEEDNWKIDFDDIKKKLDNNVKLLCVINPNNPTGSVLEKDEILKLIEIVDEYPNCTIISDEIYNKFNFDNNHISIASLSKKTPVITLNGISKGYFAPGWRIGYIAIHDPKDRLEYVRDGIEKLLRGRLSAPTPAQHGFLAALNQKEDWRVNYNKKLIKQRNYCVERINDIDGISVRKPKGAFYIFPKIEYNRYKTDKEFVLKFLEKEKVLLVHGSGFSKEYGKNHIRIVYLPDIKVLEIAFDRLKSFMK